MMLPGKGCPVSGSTIVTRIAPAKATASAAPRKAGKTGKPGANIAVDDPYNLYFTPDGKYAIVVAEAFKRLDFRDAKTMKMDYSIPTPDCAGINHADFSIDGRHAIFTCEFGGWTKTMLLMPGVLWPHWSKKQQDEVAAAIAFFLDPANAWITGQVLGVDGGLGSIRPR